MAAYRCTRCGESFDARNVSCPTPGCDGGMNSYERVNERTIRRQGATTLPGAVGGRGALVRLDSVAASDGGRIRSGLTEWDRVTGGGMVPGSLLLLAGEPGAGKSTLLLQVVDAIVRSGKRAIYVTGEESAAQIRLRAERLGLDLGSLEVLATGDAETAATLIASERPDFAVIDSVQTVSVERSEGTPGSPAQVREVTNLLLRAAKGAGVALVLVGHVNKDAAVAGPKTLEHLVDAVLMLEGDRHGAFRVLRATKNRFGATDEIGLFEMRELGMIGIDSPTRMDDPSGDPHGRALCPVIEGSRPLLVEVQALVAKASYANGRRVAVGIGVNRLAALLAVLERHAGIDLSAHDVYVSTGAGITVAETAIDAAVCAAVASSYWSTALPAGTAVIGEVALGGGVRPVRASGSRAKEALRAGAQTIVAPTTPGAEWPAGIEVSTANDLRTMLDRLGVLKPAGATGVPGGKGATTPPWFYGKRKGKDGDEGDDE